MLYTHDLGPDEADEGRPADEMTNERFGVLVLRAARVERDFEATDELTDYLLLKARPWVMSFPLADREEAAAAIMHKAWRAAASLMRRPIMVPRNYVITARRNAYRDLVVDAIRKRMHEQVHDFTDGKLDPVDHANTASDRLNWTEIDRLLRQLRQDGRTAGNPTTVKIADSLLICLAKDLSVSEACEFMLSTCTEAETVKRTIRRDRNDVRKPLGRLVAYLQDRDIDVDGHRDGAKEQS